MIRVIYGFYRTFKRTRPDIVQTQALHANLLARPAAKLAGVPIVISTENALPDIETHAIRRLLNTPLHLVNRALDRVTDRIVVVSEDLRRRKKPKRGLPNIEVIPPPFDYDAFQTARASLPCARPLSDVEWPIVGVVGRLAREKGHQYLIAAMPDMLAYAPKTQLRIVGAGPMEAELRAQVRRLSLPPQVTFVGYQRNVYAELARMDILFVPSLSEAYPIVILEGMAMGLPVVGAQVGGIPEVIADGETGLLVPPRDASALAQAFKYLLSHPETGRRMGQRGQEKALSDFHPSRFIADHERLYENAVAASGATV
jgi:glycosyltransferase involved in cell wall biosynthesis